MTPHQAAILTVGAYLHEGGQGRSFKVDVSGSRNRRYYLTVSGSQIKTERIGEVWSCTARIEVKHSSMQVWNHKHEKYREIEEKASFDPGSFSGSISGSEWGYNGSFKGSYKKSDASEINIHGTKGMYYTTRLSKM